MGGLTSTRQEEADLFDAGFWQACEDEAGRILRRMTAVDDPQGRPDSCSDRPRTMMSAGRRR